MREILFKGKRLDSGEWVEGNYILQYDHKKNEACGFITTQEQNFEKPNFKPIEIDIKTLGQFIGLCDKNGKKIFEGDIIKLENAHIRFVFYGSTSFRHTNYGKYAKEFDHKDKGYEVIGNIYDNPEMLGEKKC